MCRRVVIAALCTAVVLGSADPAVGQDPTEEQIRQAGPIPKLPLRPNEPSFGFAERVLERLKTLGASRGPVDKKASLTDLGREVVAFAEGKRTDQVRMYVDPFTGEPWDPVVFVREATGGAGWADAE